jgi:dihydrolipoamide dehydrogenase
MRNIKLKVILVFLVILSVILFEYFQLGQYLTLEFLKQNQSLYQQHYTENRASTLFLFFVLYVFATAVSVPGAGILTLAAGALFGFQVGLFLVSIASSLGATLAFLSARYLLRDVVEKRLIKYLEPINQGMKKDGAFYLLSLRLIPIFPFFIINLVMGLTQLRTSTYLVYSWLGMLPATAVFVNAGLQLSKLQSLQEILSIKILGSLGLLGLFPLVAKILVNFYQQKKIYREFLRPTKYDYNMIVIGGGSAGLVTAYISAAVKAKVALIEKNKMGGDCLNTGCVPSKALLKTAKLAQQMRQAEKYGLNKIEPEIDFQKVMARIQNVIQKIEPHDSIRRYRQLGVECFTGEAKILNPWTVEIDGKVLTSRNITIATGAGPFIPPIPGIDKIVPLTSDNLWQLKKLPQRLVVLGGGPIGCEMAQAFARLGSQVTIVEMQDRLLAIEDREVGELLQHRFEKESITILTSHRAREIKLGVTGKVLVLENSGSIEELEFDEILVAVGRKAHVEGFGLEKLGVLLRANKTIEANEFLQTNFPNIFVCGDVTGPYQLTHTAAHQAWYCAVNGLFGRFKKFKVDYSVIPWATYTDPEVATVGLNEDRARKSGIRYEITTYDIGDLDRAIADSENYGVVRVLTAPGSDRVLGATIVGNRASELLLEFVSAMKNGIGLNKILATIHVYPTMGEANKYLAGEWKRKHVPARLMTWLERFHSWNR